jgi:hypothetical protein
VFNIDPQYAYPRHKKTRNTHGSYIFRYCPSRFFLFFISYTFINTYLKNRAKKVALELTENEIIDVGGNRNILWSEVYNLVFEKGKTKVIFKDEKRERLTISMRKIKGDAFDNYNIIYDYMEAVEKQSKAQAANA